jgi:hypothetical protein
VEISYAPPEWATEDILSIAYQSVPKDRITGVGIECLVAPVLPANSGIQGAQTIFQTRLTRERKLNPGNPGDYISVIAGVYEEYPIVSRTVAQLERLRQTQEQLNRRMS